MKKILAILMVLALFLSCAAAENAAENEDDSLDFPRSGLTWQYGDLLDNLNGLIVETMDYGELSRDGGMIVAGILYTEQTNEELNAFSTKTAALREEGKTEEAAEMTKEFAEACPLLFWVIGVQEEKMTVEAALAYIAQGAGATEYREPVKLGDQDGFTYYLTVPAADSTILEKAKKHMTAEGIAALSAVYDGIMAHPELFILKKREVENDYAAPGTKISFETTDLEGNRVTSEELFSANKITLINFWQTFCEACIDEMPELDRLNREYGDKGFAVIGCVADVGNDEKKLETAKKISSPYSYRTILLSADLYEALPLHSTPTSYLLDSEGTVLAWPIEGKHLDEIVKDIEAYLAGETTEVPTEPAAVSGDEQTWKVCVTDQNGDPVPEAIVSFCTASSCTPVEVDEDGVGTFTGPAYSYHVRIVDLPDGYNDDDVEDIYTDEHSSSISITVNRE